MKDSRLLVLAGLFLLFVAVSTIDFPFWSAESGLHHYLPWIVLGLILFVVRRSGGCCRRPCCESPGETNPEA